VNSPGNRCSASADRLYRPEQATTLTHPHPYVPTIRTSLRQNGWVNHLFYRGDYAHFFQFVTLLPFSPQTPKEVGQIIVIQGTGTERDNYLRLASRSRGEYLRTHFKNMREVAAALRGKPYIRMVYRRERLTAAPPRLEIDQSLSLPRGRQGAQAGHSVPTIQWRCWSRFAG
jgi:hypothetical protein